MLVQATSDPTWQADVANFVTKWNGLRSKSARSNLVSIWDEPLIQPISIFFSCQFWSATWAWANNSAFYFLGHGLLHAISFLGLDHFTIHFLFNFQSLFPLIYFGAWPFQSPNRFGPIDILSTSWFGLCLFMSNNIYIINIHSSQIQCQYIFQSRNKFQVNIAASKYTPNSQQNHQ